jgi:aerobic carbon-monoxide dehydrogenase small subunit
MIDIELSVNGNSIKATIEERTLLLDFLRDEARLVGARNGCYEGRCGCCTVLLDGRPVKSCNVLALQAEGHGVSTVEALTPMGMRSIENPTTEGSVEVFEAIRARGVDASELHPLQIAFHEHGALQCGYCTSGMLVVLSAFLSENPRPTEAEVREALRGNLCRCTGYQMIVDAALSAAERMAEGGDGAGSPNG